MFIFVENRLLDSLFSILFCIFTENLSLKVLFFKHSQWNDTTVSTARTMNGPIEAQPTVRIMKRDNAPSAGTKQVQAEKPVDK